MVLSCAENQHQAQLAQQPLLHAAGCEPQRRVQPLPRRRRHERKKPAVRAVAFEDEVEREHKARNDLNQSARPRLERGQQVRCPAAQPALDPGDEVFGVNAVGIGNRSDLGQNCWNTAGQFAGEGLKVVDDRRQCEESEQRERARHGQQQDEDGRRSVKRLPSANANPRRGPHHRRKHHRKKRRNVKQRQHPANQPGHVERQRQGKEEHDVSADVMLALRGLLRLRGLIHAFRSLLTGLMRSNDGSLRTVHRPPFTALRHCPLMSPPTIPPSTPAAGVCAASGCGRYS